VAGAWFHVHSIPQRWSGGGFALRACVHLRSRSRSRGARRVWIGGSSGIGRRADGHTDRDGHRPAVWQAPSAVLSGPDWTLVSPAGGCDLAVSAGAATRSLFDGLGCRVDRGPLRRGALASPAHSHVTVRVRAGRAATLAGRYAATVIYARSTVTLVPTVLAGPPASWS
jgi:hypothetical protein